MISKVISELWVKLGIDTAGFDASVTHAQTKLGQIGETLQKLAVPVAAFGTASYLAIEKFGGMAQSLKDLSYQTGISTADLQHLQYAAMISGTEFSSVSGALNKLTISMAEARDPASKAYAAFMGLGVDPSGKTPQQVFDATAAALVSMEDETSRNNLAMEIYGLRWKDLLPMMDTYIEKADEIKKSPIISDADLKRLEESKIAIDKLNNSITILSGTLIAFVQNSFSAPYEQKSFSTMARAYAKLMSGDVQGFFTEAGAYHDAQQAIETQKAIDQATNPNNILPGYESLPGTTGTSAGALEMQKKLAAAAARKQAGKATVEDEVLLIMGPNYGGSGANNVPSSTYLGPGVGELDPLYSALRGSSGVSSSVRGEMQNYEAAMAAWRLNQANTVNLGMYAGGSFGGGEGSTGSTDAYGMRYSDISRWKSLFSQELIRVAAVEATKQKAYTAAFSAGDIYNIYVNDPLAAAAAISRQQAAAANRERLQ